MTETISYNDLIEWHGVAKVHASKMRSSSNDISIQESKVPNFNVPEFVGDTLKGDLFEEIVVSTFSNNAMASFLTSEKHYDNHPAWSGGFASRLRDDISNSSILEYLSTELEEKQNYPKVWKQIRTKLSTADIKIARMSQD